MTAPGRWFHVKPSEWFHVKHDDDDDVWDDDDDPDGDELAAFVRSLAPSQPSIFDQRRRDDVSRETEQPA